MPYYMNPTVVPTGIAYWASQLLDIVGAAQSQGIDRKSDKSRKYLVIQLAAELE